MLIRVNNDVTAGVDHWSLVNPKVTSLLTLINIGPPTSVRALSHNRQRRFSPFMLTGSQTSGKVHSITTPVNQAMRPGEAR